MATMIKTICPKCQKEFKIPLYTYTYRKKNNRSLVFYCSIECAHPTLKQKVVCKQCNKTFIKKNAEVQKTPNNFCSHSCSCIYQNTHKTSGYRRSKLEIFLEEQIKSTYPDLELYCNNKTVIVSELDFYFPSLRFAIETNGIFHYELIYGNDRFEKIQNNDSQKIIKCAEKGIELCILDVSSISNLTQKQKDKWWNIVNNILSQIIHRK